MLAAPFVFNSALIVSFGREDDEGKVFGAGGAELAAGDDAAASCGDSFVLSLSVTGCSNA